MQLLQISTAKEQLFEKMIGIISTSNVLILTCGYNVSGTFEKFISEAQTAQI